MAFSYELITKKNIHRYYNYLKFSKTQSQKLSKISKIYFQKTPLKGHI